MVLATTTIVLFCKRLRVRRAAQRELRVSSKVKVSALYESINPHTIKTAAGFCADILQKGDSSCARS